MIVHHLTLLLFIMGTMSGRSFRSFTLPRLKRIISKNTLTRSMSYGEDDGETDDDLTQDTYDTDEFEFPKERQSIYKSSSVKTVKVNVNFSVTVFRHLLTISCPFLF